MMKIDLNSDLGEGFGHYQLGNDKKIIPLVTSCNIACGFHAGDYNVIKSTVKWAEQNEIGVGAHPGFPDLNGFGRRFIDMDLESVANMVTYQIASVSGFTKLNRLHHVKPHGALYNIASKNLDYALAICKGIKCFDSNLPVYALANSKLVQAAKQMKLPVVQEVFADRNYEADGSLVSRKKRNAVLKNPNEIAKRAVGMIQNQSVKSIDGFIVPIKADSICVHGDNESALIIVNQLLTTLKKAKIEVKTY